MYKSTHSSLDMGREGSAMPLLSSQSTTDSVQKPAMSFMRVASFILVNEFCERLAFYGILSNLVLFLGSRLHLLDEQADSVALIFSGTCYLTPLLGGWFADAQWGRFKTIMVFICIYILGMALLSFSTLHEFTSAPLVYIALLLIATGTGGIKPNVSSFGADQFPEDDETDRQRFFAWFYWMINCGALLAFSVVAYVQQNIGFTAGYLIPTFSMLISFIAFVAGRRHYTRLPPGGSVVSRTVRIVAEATQCCQPCRRAGCCGNKAGLPVITRATSSTLSLRSPGAAGSSGKRASFLDRAKVTNGGTFLSSEVEDVKEFGRVIPVLLTFCLYWIVDNQVSSVFLSQGEVLDLTLGSFTIPVAALGMADAIVIMVLIPIMDKWMYPFLQRRGLNLSMLQRIGVGFLLATAAMGVSGLVEMLRLHRVHQGRVHQQTVAGARVIAADMSIFWQIPQYALIGGSEVFAATTGLEFAYSQSPSNMRSVVMALFLFTNAIGDYIGSALLAAVNGLSAPHEWIPKNLNNGRLDLYYYFLGGVMVVNIVVLYVVSRNYVYKDAAVSKLGGLGAQEEADAGRAASRTYSGRPLYTESPRGPVRKSVYERAVSK